MSDGSDNGNGFKLTMSVFQGRVLTAIENLTRTTEKLEASMDALWEKIDEVKEDLTKAISDIRIETREREIELEKQFTDEIIAMKLEAKDSGVKRGSLITAIVLVILDILARMSGADGWLNKFLENL